MTSPTIKPPGGHCMSVGIALVDFAVVMCCCCVQKLTFMGRSLLVKLSCEKPHFTELDQPAFFTPA